MDKSLIVALVLFPLVALGQTHTFPGNNVFPSTSTTDFNAGATVDFTGATVTGLAAGGAVWGGITGTLSSQTDLQTALNAKATSATTLAGYGITDAQPLDSDLTAWSSKTTYAGTVTVTTGKTFNCTGNLTLSGTDGSTLNVGGGGTLGTAAYTASTAYQAADSDLTTWAGVTPTSGIQTWLATPSSANLRGAVTDENGTGALLFSGATTPDFTTGFTIGAAAASGKIPIGNGTNYVPSTPTFSNAPSTALKWMRSDGTNWITSTSLLSDTPSTAGKVLISDGTNWITSTPTYPNAAGAVGYTIRSDATNFASYPQDIINTSVSSQSPSTSEVYVTGSNCVVTAGDFKAKGQYRCTFDIVKSAGTGIPAVAVKIGTAGGTGDTTQLTFTFPGAGTSVADTGSIEVVANWRTVGSGSSAVVAGYCKALKNNVTAAGLWGTTSASLVIVSTVSGGFNSSTATNIGVTFNGGTAFAGTITTVQSTLMQ